MPGLYPDLGDIPAARRQRLTQPDQLGVSGAGGAFAMDPDLPDEWVSQGESPAVATATGFVMAGKLATRRSCRA